MTTEEHAGVRKGNEWLILLAARATCEEFVEFWDRQYSGYDEQFYQQNIGQPLTPDRIHQWFEWKNGSALSSRKLKPACLNQTKGPSFEQG